MTLQRRLRGSSLISQTEKCFIAAQLIALVGEMHRSGICHINLMPDNIYLSHGWKVRLRQFASDLSQTEPFRISLVNGVQDMYNMFQKSYIAPEQLIFHLSESTQERTTFRQWQNVDQFGLGCLLVELFNEGRHLFTFQSLSDYVDYS
ncbi:MAG: hypothetical protein EZS28_012581 [Streblomastix strix]|uniref:Protein kinase domain-containing protein n=1 Tax=Streblomastix strix TaxID=222440 RepID=A0A5J4WAG4_9EUKA|nr:MAG: hypothetical protein EZS28_012581 [Streblomastix strix]